MGSPRDDDTPEDGLGALSIREVVESALEQEDIMPVVSYSKTYQPHHTQHLKITDQAQELSTGWTRLSSILQFNMLQWPVTLYRHNRWPGGKVKAGPKLLQLQASIN